MSEKTEAQIKETRRGKEGREAKLKKQRLAGLPEGFELPEKGPSDQRVFTAQIQIEPVRTSVDLKWPDESTICVVTHDEIMRFPGLRQFLARNRQIRRAVLTLEIKEEIGQAVMDPIGAPKTEPLRGCHKEVKSKLTEADEEVLEGLREHLEESLDVSEDDELDGEDLSE